MRGARRGTATAGWLVLLLVALTLGGCGGSMNGLSEGVTPEARVIRELWTVLLVAGLVIYVFVQGLIVWAVLRYRRRDDALPRQTHGNNLLEITWTAIPLVIVTALFLLSWQGIQRVNAQSGEGEQVRLIRVEGFQWQWNFTYVGEEVPPPPEQPAGQNQQAQGQGQQQQGQGGQQQPADAQQQDQEQTQEQGREEQPEGQAPQQEGQGQGQGQGQEQPREPESLRLEGTIAKPPELVLPVNEPVRFELQSADVIHAFYVPEFHYKLDVIPGRDNSFEVTPDRVGTYTGQCAEYCGLAHNDMHFTIKVVERPEFEAWLADAKKKAASGCPGDDTPGQISSKDIAFDKTCLIAEAGQPYQLKYTNEESEPHNVAVFDGENAQAPNIFRGEIISGPGKTVTYNVGNLEPGQYFFHCDVHPEAMKGTLVVQ
jgi:cytochrome c oxidase subunit II